MKSSEYKKHVEKTLEYIQSLPEKERIVERDAMINYFKSNNRYRVYDHAHYKFMKRLFELSGKIPI